MANYSETKLVGVVFKLRKKIKNSLSCVNSCSRQNLEFGHFMLLFDRGWQRNVPIENLKHTCRLIDFPIKPILFCGVVIASSWLLLKLPNAADFKTAVFMVVSIYTRQFSKFAYIT